MDRQFQSLFFYLNSLLPLQRRSGEVACRLSRFVRVIALALIVIGTCSSVPGATVEWTANSDGDWGTASNWYPFLPGANDDVLIARDGTLTVYLGQSVSVKSLTAAESISIQGGTLNIAEASTISGALTINSGFGTIGGAGNLTLSGPVALSSGGSMGGTGTTFLTSTSTSNFFGSFTIGRAIENSGHLSAGNGTTTSMSVTFNGGSLKNMTGGKISLSNANFGSSPPGALFENFGTVEKISGSSTISPGLQNLASGVVNLFGGSLTLSASSVNQGTYNIHQGAVFNFSSFLNEGAVNFHGNNTIGNVSNSATGTINALAGILTFSQAGTNSGSINVADGATVHITGNYAMAAGSSIKGTGAVVLSSPIDFSGSLQSTGGVTLNSAVAFNANQSLNTGVTINSSGGIAGAGDVTINGPLSWNGGTISGTGKTILGSNSVVYHAGAVTLSRTLDNHGAFTFSPASGVSLNIASQGIMNNYGVFDISTGSGVSGSIAGSGVINNFGEINRAGAQSAPAFAVNPLFNNSSTGVVNLFNSDLTLRGTNEGKFYVGPGVTHTVPTNMKHMAGSSIEGPGSVVFSSGQTNPFLGQFKSTGPISFSNLRIDSDQTIVGSLTAGGFFGSGNVTIANSMTLVGEMSGSGKTTIAEGATMSVTTGSASITRPFDNLGTVFLSGGLSASNMNNHGDIYSTGAASLSLSSNGVINNFGNYHKLSTDTPTFAGGTFNNEESGFVGLYAGSMKLSRGTNEGTIHVGTGATLSFDERFTHAPDSVIEGNGTIALGPAGLIVLAGKFNATGNVTVQGTTVSFPEDQEIRSVMTLNSSGILTGAGDLSIQRSLTANTGSTIAGSGKFTVNAGAIVSLAGTTLSRTLENEGTLSLGSFSLVDGKIVNRGLIVGAVNITGSGANNVIENEGLINATSFLSTQPFVNESSGTVNVNSFTAAGRNDGVINAGIISSAASGSLENFGIVNLNVSGSQPVSSSLVNTVNGTVNLLGGTTQLRIANSGKIHIASGATGYIKDEGFHFAGSSITGPGTLIVDLPYQNFVGSIHTTGPLTLASSFEINAPQQLRGPVSMAATASELKGSADVTFSDALTWNTGKMTGTGKSIIAPEGIVTIATSGTKILSRTLENKGTIHLSATLQVTDGVLDNQGLMITTSGIVTPNATSLFTNTGTITKTGAGPSTLTKLQNSGVVNVAEGGLSLVDGQNSGLIHVGAGAGLSSSSATPYLNTGTIRFAGTNSIFASNFNNSVTGTISSAAGRLTVIGSGTNFGTIHASAGATIEISNDYVQASGSKFTGPGSFELGSITDFSGDIQSTGSVVLLNAVTFNKAQQIAGTMFLSSSDARVAGNADVQVEGGLYWGAGRMVGSGKTTLGASSNSTFRNFSGSTELARILENNGTLTVDHFSSSSLTFNSGTLVNNGTMHVKSSMSFINFGNPSANRFSNNGTLLINGSSGMVIIDVPFENKGTLNLSGKTLSFGSFTQIGGIVEGSWKVSNGGSITGASAPSFYEIAPTGAVELSGAFSVQNFQIRTNHGKYHLSGGSHSGPTPPLPPTGNPWFFTNTGEFTLSNNAIYHLGTTLNENPVGTINVTNSTLYLLGVNSNVLNLDGNVVISSASQSSVANKIETLNFGANGKFDLRSSDLIIGTGSVDTVRDQIKLGLGGTKGLTTSAAIENQIGLAYAAGNDPHVASSLGGVLGGKTYDEDSVLVKYTYFGDADLDGDSDLNDLGLWAQSFTGDLGITPDGTPATFWTSGDFDYDGDTDLNDLGFWAGTFTGDLGGGAGSLVVLAPGAPDAAILVLNGMGITVIPEPNVVYGAIGITTLAFLTYRRRLSRDSYAVRV